MSATLIERRGDENWTQTSYGETPCSVSLSTNAKGAAQVDIKLVYQSAEHMAKDAERDFTEIISAVKRALAEQGITLAGMEGR